MNSESILLSMPPEEKTRARAVAAACNLDDCLAGVDCQSMSALSLVGIINDRVLPMANRAPDGKHVATGLGDMKDVLSGIDLEALAKSFGLAAVAVVREQILPRIRDASATAALIASNLLELVEGKLRGA